jgi:hypothetical protein
MELYLHVPYAIMSLTGTTLSLPLRRVFLALLILKLEWVQTVKRESGMCLGVTRVCAEFKLLPGNIL